MTNPYGSSLSAPATLLAIGDVHLGTRCSGLPDDLSLLGIDSDQLTPAAALDRAVDLAIQKNVDAVVFAGDVVESTNDRFEALVPIERNLRRLLDERIQVIAVAGNHDVKALPRLASLIDGFTLLGAGGKWESCIVERNGHALVEIVGWSFDDRIVRQSPVAQLLTEASYRASSEIPRIGLLHADLGASGGNYAPIRQSELDQSGFDAWLLGHIHKPSIDTLSETSSRFPFGYLGSLVGLDATETGPHGPWLVTVNGVGDVRAEQQAVVPLRWEPLLVSIAETDDAEDVLDKISSAAEVKARQIFDLGEPPRALGLRVRVEGATRHYDPISKMIVNGDWSEIRRVVGDTGVFIHKVDNCMSSAVDLNEIAIGDDPPALLARRILSLQQNDQKAALLLEETRSRLAEFANESQWFPLKDQRNSVDPLSDDRLRGLMLQAGMSTLQAMLEQKSGPDQQ